VTLVAFAADRINCCCAPLLLGAARAAIDRYHLHWAITSKPAARCWSIADADRRTD